MEQVTTPRRRPTIRDIAAEAGVSRGTVSRVLNGGHWVSPEARAAVESAITRTGYRANHHARSLATGRANSVAFLLTEPHQLLFEDPTFSRLLRGAAAMLSRRGMTLVLLVASTRAERDSVAQFVEAGHVDGVLLISSHEAEPLVQTLVDGGTPTVVTGLPLGFEGVLPVVSVDEIASAREMTRYLRDRGHRRIAMIAGPDDTPGGRYRLVGFREEMGSDFDRALVARGDYGRESGRLAMTSLLATHRDIDAVFAASDSMAAGAVAALREAGLRVPEDVAVAGFDDSGLAATLDPPLTTMRQPWDALSDAMVELLVEAIAGQPARTVTLPTELIRRDSA
jgi:DNA-binding LacI/PurR family transcriptional regulator